MIVKVCGITNIEDARRALDAGADWVGLNLVSGPRKISVTTARQILEALDEPSQVVGLVSLPDIYGNLAMLIGGPPPNLRRIQAYGCCPDADWMTQMRDTGVETILVHHVRNEQSLDELDATLDKLGNARPDFLLLDTFIKGELGGTGRAVDWELLARARDTGRFTRWPPVILAGGLNERNVARAIRLVQPDGVDVSSGVESAPGKKDAERVRRFIDAAKSEPITG